MVMGVVPPWHLQLSNVTIDKGYSLIFLPLDYEQASIDFGRLAIQWIIVGAVAWGVAKLRK